MEAWVVFLLLAVLVMAESLRLAGRNRNEERITRAEGAVRRFDRRNPNYTRWGRFNYGLAPRNPDVMAGALFSTLSSRLGYEQMLAFAELVVSPELTDRYLERLADAPGNGTTSRQLAFLCGAMEANGYTPEQRARVSEALEARARKEYKLLKIHKSLHKIF